MHSVPSVLVLDAEQRSALAAVRSFGREGLRVLAAGAGANALAGSSRYATAYLQAPPPATQPGRFVDWLVNEVASREIGFVLPVTEVTSQLLLANRERLPSSCILPFADLSTVMQLADKGSLVQLAMRLGVRCPETLFVDQPELWNPGTVSRFPVVLKPRLSRVNLGDRWISTTVCVARDFAELRRLLEERVEFRAHPFLVQEFIHGSGAGVFALYNRGEEVATFAHRRLREKPPSGGVSVLSESRVPDSAALAISRALLGAVQWHGVAMVETRVTPEGEHVLMEVNTRLWGSLQLAIDAGVDFPWLLYQVCSNHPLGPAPNVRAGRRLRWWLGDLDSLYLLLRDHRRSSTEKLARLLAFLTPDPLRTRHEIFRWDDPAPAWFEALEWLRALRH